MRESSLRRIFDKTDGHCHFCGDAITFENRGWAEAPDGHWEVDHVIQKDKGGAKSADNCLPACMRCNRLRWHRTGESIREILLLGIIARKEIKNNSSLGHDLAQLRAIRLAQNLTRRRSNGGSA
jgi:5-methylcytosine-specific restriction endonuclease McrA